MSIDQYGVRGELKCIEFDAVNEADERYADLLPVEAIGTIIERICRFVESWCGDEFQCGFGEHLKATSVDVGFVFWKCFTKFVLS